MNVLSQEMEEKDGKGLVAVKRGRKEVEKEKGMEEVIAKERQVWG